MNINFGKSMAIGNKVNNTASSNFVIAFKAQFTRWNPSMILLMRLSGTPSAIILQNEYGKEMAPNDVLLYRDVCVP